MRRLTTLNAKSNLQGRHPVAKQQETAYIEHNICTKLVIVRLFSPFAMRRTSSSGLISTKHVLDVQDAALRYRTGKALQSEMARLKDFQTTSVGRFNADLARLQGAVGQQAAELKYAFEYQCELICERLQGLITRLNKDKHVLEALPSLTQVLTTPTILSLQSFNDTTSFHLASYLSLSASWTPLGLSFFPLPKPNPSISADSLPSITSESKIRRLDLSNQGTNASELKALVAVIPRYSAVVELDLSYSALDREAVEALGLCVKGMDKLERLVLKGNTLDGGLLRGLCLNAGIRKGVKWLNLEENRIGNTAHFLNNSLSQAFPSLQILLFQRNSLQDNDLQSLSQDLIHLPSLHTLDFSHNCITSTGLHALSLLLPHLSSLTYLDLAGNKIGDEGVVSLGRTLSYVTKLVGLGLRGNEVTERGARVLAQAAEEMMWLEGINLEDNNIRTSLLSLSERRLLKM